MSLASERTAVALLAVAVLIAGLFAGCNAQGMGENSPGIAAFPPQGSPDRSSSPFGIVKGGVGDRVIAPAWVKTVWTPQAVDGTSVDTHSWRRLLEAARKFNQIEVPVVADEVWKSGDIEEIKNEMRHFFQADPHVTVWEMGLEENLQSGWEENLPETAQKLAAVRQVKDSINPDIKLAYQIVGDTGKSLETFLKSEASNYVDIIALHPYGWPDFKPPELWLDRYLAEVKSLKTTYGKNLPVWFTEVGAPTDEGGVPLYSGSRRVYGLTPEEQADYLTKVYAMALNHGVDKIFWYEYRDSCSAASDVECHFGLKYNDGTPKPAYYAYKAISDCIGNKRPAGERIEGGTRISSFKGRSQECHVVWQYPGSETTFPLSAIAATSRDTRAFDVMGKPVPISRERVEISESPLLLHVSR